MRKYVFRIAGVALLIFGGAVATAMAQPEPIAGGYIGARTTDKAVRRAANVGVREHARREHHSVTLIKIIKAEQQVVAGMNYRLCLRVKRPRHAAHTVTAVVYEPIRKPMRLTNWEEGGCKEL